MADAKMLWAAGQRSKGALQSGRASPVCHRRSHGAACVSSVAALKKLRQCTQTPAELKTTVIQVRACRGDSIFKCTVPDALLCAATVHLQALIRAGHTVLQATHEADGVLAQLGASNAVHAVLTTDTDQIAYLHCPRVLFQLTWTGEATLYSSKHLADADVFKGAGLTREQVHCHTAWRDAFT